MVTRRGRSDMCGQRFGRCAFPALYLALYLIAAITETTAETTKRSPPDDGLRESQLYSLA